MTYHAIKALLPELAEGVAHFTRELIRTPSPAGQEGAIARLIAAKLQELGYQDVHTDRAGNVTGRVRGERPGAGRILYLNHMDHADPGPEENWDVPPFAGEQQGQFILGCGASASKGALAAQIYAGHLLQRLGWELPSDYIFAATVQESTGTCLGTAHLCEDTLKPELEQIALVVLGNATSLDLYLGHRGRAEILIETLGRTCHSSAPWLGINAIYLLAPVLEELQQLSENLPSHHFIEKSTLAAVGIAAVPGHTGTVPDRCLLTVDRRFLPTEPVEEVMGQLESIVHRISLRDPSFKARVRLRQLELTTYTGCAATVPCLMQPFLMEESHPVVTAACTGLAQVQGEPNLSAWKFHTDGSYTAGVKQIPTLGYSPGEEKYVNTTYDRVDVDKLLQAVAGYAAIYARVAGMRSKLVCGSWR